MLGQKIKIKNHKTRLADITLNTSNLKLTISISWQTASNSHTPISLCPYQYDTSWRKQKPQEKMKARRIIFHLPTTELPCKGVYFCVSSYLMEDISLTKANFSTCDFHLLSCIFYILFFAGWTPHFLYLPTHFFVPVTANLTKVVYIQCLDLLVSHSFFKTIFHSPLCCIPEINLNVISN